MVTGIEHVAICAKNSTELKNWYQRVFGFELVRENNEKTYFLKAQNGFMLEIIQETEPGDLPGEKQGGIRHIAFTVDAFEEMIALLIREKVSLITDPVTFFNTEGGLDSRPKASGLFSFRDPEGNILQFVKRQQPL